MCLYFSQYFAILNLCIDTTYLDHAGTTLYARSLIDDCASDLKANLYANPHSGAESSQRSSDRVEEARLALLQYFNADPEVYDVVFVANATAGIKLVAEAFRDNATGFDYAYHPQSHTSLVGVRQLAKSSRCVASEGELDHWLAQQPRFTIRRPRLIAIPGQSNLTGFRPNVGMYAQIKNARSSKNRAYLLLDAAALASTSPLQVDLRDPQESPDFIDMSMYKIFGYPDLGALFIKKSSSHIIRRKHYFGGGTVDMVTSDKPWHIKKELLHEALEEGTLPFHNIVSLDHALDIHKKLYGSPSNVLRHARYLAETARTKLGHLTHSNNTNLCHIYSSEFTDTSQGPVVAFNLVDPSGRYFRNYLVERLAIKHNIALRVGGMCNPGGIQTALSIPYSEMKRNYDTGVRCGDDSDLPDDFHGSIGMVRVSIGAMSSRAAVESLLNFVSGFVDQNVFYLMPKEDLNKGETTSKPGFAEQHNGMVARPAWVSIADHYEEKPTHGVIATAWRSFKHIFGCF